MALPDPIWSETLTSDPVGILATGSITAKRFVGYNGQHCGAGKKAVGVAYWGAASGEQVTLYGPGNIVLVEAAGDIDPGDLVASDANGKATRCAALTATVPGSGTPVSSSSAEPAMTMAGGVVPSIINGMALGDAETDGDVIAVLVM